MFRFILPVTFVFLLSVFVSGCVTALETVDKSSQPIPAKLLASMRSKGMTPSDPIFIRLLKEESELEVWKRDRSGKYALLKIYPICRWSGQLGPKTKDGDRQAPEGFYEVTATRLNPRSDYYLSFNLGYPNRLEKALGYGGSAIMVHGACSSSGCYALTDRGMAEIYPVVRDALAGGQNAVQVQSLPFRMTVANMLKHRSDPNFAFWKVLKIGYDTFEVTQQPPQVGACGGHYVFSTSVAAKPPEDPIGECPEGANKLEPTIADKEAKDNIKLADLALNPSVATNPHAYLDGSMNAYFQTIMSRQGPTKLAEMTSLTNVPVSRPRAALFDPHASTPRAMGANAATNQAILWRPPQ